MYVTVNFKHELTETPADTRHANTRTHTRTHSYKRLLQMLSVRNVLRVTLYVSIRQESCNSTNQIILLPTEKNVANISFFHAKGTPFNVFILEVEVRNVREFLEI